MPNPSSEVVTERVRGLLRELVKKLGKQCLAAKACGISEPVMSRLLAGKKSWDTLSGATQRKISEGLGVSLASLHAVGNLQWQHFDLKDFNTYNTIEGSMEQGDELLIVDRSINAPLVPKRIGLHMEQIDVGRHNLDPEEHRRRIETFRAIAEVRHERRYGHSKGCFERCVGPPDPLIQAIHATATECPNEIQELLDKIKYHSSETAIGFVGDPQAWVDIQSGICKCLNDTQWDCVAVRDRSATLLWRKSGLSLSEDPNIAKAVRELLDRKLDDAIPNFPGGITAKNRKALMRRTAEQTAETIKRMVGSVI